MIRMITMLHLRIVIITIILLLLSMYAMCLLNVVGKTLRIICVRLVMWIKLIFYTMMMVVLKAVLLLLIKSHMMLNVPFVNCKTLYCMVDLSLSEKIENKLLNSIPPNLCSFLLETYLMIPIGGILNIISGNVVKLKGLKLWRDLMVENEVMVLYDSTDLGMHKMLFDV